MTEPYFSIVIPVKALNDYIRETVSHILKLEISDWELIVVPNEESPSEWSDPRIRLVASGRVGPGEKRDLAARVSRGQILVFLDDDSYPQSDLLNKAKPLFENSDVAAVGGPAITPPEDSFWQKVSGAVFLSRFSGGAPERYVSLGKARPVDDWPSVNLMVRRSDFLQVKGFDCKYWPGEDTKLCLKLIKSGKKILYSPDLIVWHHRRPGFFAHLKQIGGYGLHRGFFAKRYPETSFRLGYFVPSFFLIFACLSIFLVFVRPHSFLSSASVALWVFYGGGLIKAFFDFLRYVSFPISFFALIYTFFTHLYYGFQFLRGFLFVRNLVSPLR